MFTSIIQDGIEKPQCVICEKVLAVEGMELNKLQKHFKRLHGDMLNEDIAEFQWLAEEIIKKKSNESELQKTKHRRRLIMENDFRCLQILL